MNVLLIILVLNEIVIIDNKTDLDTNLTSFHVFNENCTVINEYDIENFNLNVLLAYSKYNTKLSFTDSSIITVMKENNIQNLVSFDKYFDRVNNIRRIC